MDSEPDLIRLALTHSTINIEGTGGLYTLTMSAPLVTLGLHDLPITPLVLQALVEMG